MLLGVIVGLVAEWLRRGLQILAPRFDSGRCLQSNQKVTTGRAIRAGARPDIFPLTAILRRTIVRHGSDKTPPGTRMGTANDQAMGQSRRGNGGLLSHPRYAVFRGADYSQF